MAVSFQSLSTFKSLVCHLCDGWLSVAPIYEIPGKGYACGRCQTYIPDSSSVVRQTAYETAVKCMKFPCINSDNGCGTQLDWDEILNHEEKCIYKKITCPIQAEFGESFVCCNWIGSVSSLYDHIEKDHMDHVLNPLEFAMDLEDENPHLFFTSAVSQCFAFYVRYNKEKGKLLSVLLLIGNDSVEDSFRYKIELLANNTINSVTVNRAAVKKLSNIFDDVKDEKKMIQIDVSTVKNVLDNPESFSLKISIIDNNQTVLEETPGIKQISSELANFECPICNEYLAPPVYVCVIGHSICKRCRLKLDVCPSCKNYFQNTRNFFLENLVANLNYPCPYHTKGCTFIDTLYKVEEHEQLCKFADRQCILECPWSGSIESMINHLHDSHRESIIESEVIHNFHIRVNQKTHLILLWDSQIFRLSIEANKHCGAVSFTMQSFCDKLKYMYTLTLIDQTRPGVSFVINRPCGKFTKLSDVINDNFTLPVRDLLLINERFYFKISVCPS